MAQTDQKVTQRHEVCCWEKRHKALTDFLGAGLPQICDLFEKKKATSRKHNKAKRKKKV